MTLPTNEAFVNGDDGIALVQAARAAWTKIKGQHWKDWLAVGRAYVHGSTLAMRIAGSNRPFGRGYQRVFAEWATRTGFDIIQFDKPTRSVLRKIFDHLPEIEAWLATLQRNKRRALNHPQAVLKAWRAAHRVPTTAAPGQGMRSQLQSLIEQNDRLTAQLDERRDSALLVKFDSDRSEDIVAALVNDPAILRHRSKAVKIFREVARCLEGS